MNKKHNSGFLSTNINDTNNRGLVLRNFQKPIFKLAISDE